MFEHVRKWFPWRERAKRRKEFLNKLKGESTFKIKKNTPRSAIFMLMDNNTGGMDTYVYASDNRWAVCGSSLSITRKNLVTTFTVRQLEIHLSKLVRESDPNSIHIIDENCYLSRVKPS